MTVFPLSAPSTAMKGAVKRVLRSRYAYALPFVLLIGLSIPRFNQTQTIFGTIRTSAEHNADAVSYRSMVRYFRSDALGPEVTAPFGYRVLAPYLASLLPFDEVTALSTINVLFLSASLAFVLLTVRGRAYPSLDAYEPAVLAGLLYSLSFPVLWYTTSGFIDAVALCFIAAGFYALVCDRMILFTATVVVGAFANEKVVLLVVLLLARVIHEKGRRRRAAFWLVLNGLALAVSLLAARQIVPMSKPDYWWRYDVAHVRYNLTRWRTYVSIVATLGLPGTLSGLWFIQARRVTQSLYVLAATGAFVAFAFYVFSIFTVAASGRYLWPGYPFFVILALDFLEGRVGSRPPVSGKAS
jgi:hypothetical protein